MMNEISIYYPQMKSRKMVIQTLIHEYIHYLQSPSWFKRYYNMGYHYNDHPYELEIYTLVSKRTTNYSYNKKKKVKKNNWKFKKTFVYLYKIKFNYE